MQPQQDDKSSFQFLIFFSTLRSKLRACLARGAGRDFEDTLWIVEMHAAEVRSFRDHLDQRECDQFLENIPANRRAAVAETLGRGMR